MQNRLHWERDVLRADGAEVQVDGRTARATVERKKYRARRRILRLVERVRDIHRVARRLVLRVFQMNRADSRRIVQHLAM